MKVRVGLVLSVMSVDCPKCGECRYIDEERLVQKCRWCGDAPFEVEVQLTDKWGNCEAIRR